eukprot:gene24357-29442_t
MPLTRNALSHNDLKNSDAAKERMNDELELDAKDKIRQRALKIYRNELNRPYSLDLGLHGVTRAALRVLCKESVLQSSTTMKRRYSHSALSSSIQDMIQNKNAISALRSLQKERLIVSRLGFADRAMEIDKEIEVMREKAKKARQEEEDKILAQRMKTLAISQNRKAQRLEYILAEETKQMTDRFREEEEKLLKRQEMEFIRVLENASRRAIGKVKKCNCPTPYTCRHNKTASYNTRRPTHLVVTYKRNAKRLKHAGRPEEAQMWEEKAKEIDESEQERWRSRVATSIVSSPWGANEAAVDQITEWHKKELGVLRKTHAVKTDMHEKKQAMRRKNFNNTMLAEQRKVRMQCRKQALLKVRREFAKEQLEIERQKKLEGHSDGLKNVSKNLLGGQALRRVWFHHYVLTAIHHDSSCMVAANTHLMITCLHSPTTILQFDAEERGGVDWVPPSSFGLHNSVRLLDAVKELGGAVVGDEGEGVQRILTSKQDIKSLTTEQLRDKIHSNLKGDVSDEDSDDDEEEEIKEGEGKGGYYKLGATSGSKLVDNLRMQAKSGTSGNNAPPSTPSSAPATPLVSYPTPFPAPFPAPSFGMGMGMGMGMGSAGNPFAASPSPSTPSFAAPWMGSGGGFSNPFAAASNTPGIAGNTPANNNGNVGVANGVTAAIGNSSVGNSMGSQGVTGGFSGGAAINGFPNNMPNSMGTAVMNTMANTMGNNGTVSVSNNSVSGGMSNSLGSGLASTVGNNMSNGVAPSALAGNMSTSSGNGTSNGAVAAGATMAATVPTTPIPSAPATPAPSTPSFRAGQHVVPPFPTFKAPGPPSNAPTDSMTTIHTLPSQGVGVSLIHSTPGNMSTAPTTSMQTNHNNHNTTAPTAHPSSPSVPPSSSHAHKQITLTVPHYTFDPMTDNAPIAFSCGSVKDADWVEREKQLVLLGGEENSYGIKVIVEDENDNVGKDGKELVLDVNIAEKDGNGSFHPTALQSPSSMPFATSASNNTNPFPTLESSLYFPSSPLPPTPLTPHPPATLPPPKSVLSPFSRYNRKGKVGDVCTKKVNWGTPQVFRFDTWEGGDEDAEKGEGAGEGMGPSDVDRLGLGRDIQGLMSGLAPPASSPLGSDAGDGEHVSLGQEDEPPTITPLLTAVVLRGEKEGELFKKKRAGSFDSTAGVGGIRVLDLQPFQTDGADGLGAEFTPPPSEDLEAAKEGLTVKAAISNNMNVSGGVGEDLLVAANTLSNMIPVVHPDASNPTTHSPTLLPTAAALSMPEPGGMSPVLSSFAPMANTTPSFMSASYPPMSMPSNPTNPSYAANSFNTSMSYNGVSSGNFGFPNATPNEANPNSGFNGMSMMPSNPFSFPTNAIPATAPVSMPAAFNPTSSSYPNTYQANTMPTFDPTSSNTMSFSGHMNQDDDFAPVSDSRSQSTEDTSAMLHHRGFPWDLAFHRMARISDFLTSFTEFLMDDEIFDLLEIFVGGKDGGVMGSPGGGASDEPPAHLTKQLNELCLLRAYLLQCPPNPLPASFTQPPTPPAHNLDTLCLYIEEVWGETADSQENDEHELDDGVWNSENNGDGVLQQALAKLGVGSEDGVDLHPLLPRLLPLLPFAQLLRKNAIAHTNAFILSPEFASYYDARAPPKAHTKRLTPDSKSFLGKLQRAVGEGSGGLVYVHIFPGGVGGGGRPWANKRMRNDFGPLCDAPTPLEYVVNSTDMQAVTLTTSMPSPPASSFPSVHDLFSYLFTRAGEGEVSGVEARCVRVGNNHNRRSMKVKISLRTLKSVKKRGEIKYSVVYMTELEGEESDIRLAAIQGLASCVPSILEQDSNT